MFSTYKRVFWLAALMTIFYYVPFHVVGFSTDVWTRLARIREWAATGFPLQEQLMMSQNYPFGMEMHWTRLMDWIGYAFAWPFIPSMGIKDALEITAYITPLLAILVAVRGFFFGIRGYLTPRVAFLAFWLLFWGIGYSWTQARVGYFDHHIFHFAILVWTIALIARSCRVSDNRICLYLAGVLTAVGSWITGIAVEFFLNVYFLIIPFLTGWLLKNKSLKPALIYTATYTLVLLGFVGFDHPIGGFLTLDFYRTSLFHVLLGGVTVAALGLLCLPCLRTSTARRLIFGILVAVTFGLGFFIAFADIIVVPSADPLMNNIWMKKVGELTPLYEIWDWLVIFAVLPVLLSIGFIVWLPLHLRHRLAPLVLSTVFGLLFYSLLSVFHMRFCISANAFFIFLGSCYFALTFFPHEHSFRRTLYFLLFYLTFIGVALKGTDVINRFRGWGIRHYLELYKKDPSIEVPDYLKEAFEKELEKEKQKANNNTSPSADTTTNNTLAPKDNTPPREENKSYACEPNKDTWEVIAADKDNGAVLTDIFSAPQILWETGKPVIGGPYHTNVDGLTDLFLIQLDRPPFERARRLIQKHHITQIYFHNPRCENFLFENTPNQKPVENPETTFHHAVYYESEDLMPSWLKLEYHNKENQIKIFRVIEDTQ